MLADDIPGFVWRLQTGLGDATAIRAYDDETLFFNMSVWPSPEALFSYTCRGNHVQLLARRMEWFTPPAAPSLAPWWIPAGHQPTVEEARERLALVAENGPTPEAFSFGKLFSPQGIPNLPAGK